FHMGTITGSTEAIASASKASKKVATPTMIRTFTCQAEVGSRSMRATTPSAADWRPVRSADMFAVAATFVLDDRKQEPRMQRTSSAWPADRGEALAPPDRTRRGRRGPPDQF